MTQGGSATTTTVRLDGDDWRLVSALPGRWSDPDLPGAVLADDRDWIPARVPGAVQDDLWRAGLIDDPYVGRNSLAAEWAADRTWVYERSFPSSPDWRDRRVHLRFDGVDYAARFLLNGVVLGEHESMTTPAVFDVTDRLDLEGRNSLVVVLAPAPVEQDQLGRTSLVRTRKNRMGYWWDFCPRLVNLGLIGSVTLEVTGDARIEDLAMHPRVAPDRRTCTVTAEVAVRSFSTKLVTATIEVTRDGRAVATVDVAVPPGTGVSVATAELEVAEPELWWPNGYGDQPLYEATARVHNDGGHLSDERSTTFGLRTIELAPNETDDGTAPPYTFVVNGRRTWMAGWNWVPVDALYGVPYEDKVTHLLELAAAAHCTLLRVNGVGLLEREHFYAECDRLGILVWQEFLLTSSATDRKPSEDAEYLAEVVAEARAMVPLRRNHPSLGLWCAGNELESLEKLPLDDSEPVIGALREVAAELDPDTVWLPTSARGRKPFNGLSSIRRDPDGLHDVHGPWLYEGLTEQYELYNAGTSLFHSELGAEGITNAEAVAAVLPDPADRTVDALGNPRWRHLSAWWVRDELWRETFGPVADFDLLIAATQFLQGEAVRYGLESNRRRAWRNSGSLPWQFNEPYPMLGSTAAIDYYGRPKELYWAIEEAYRPLAVSARYETLAWGSRERFEAELWVVNSGPEVPGATLQARLLDSAGAVLAEQSLAGTVAADGPTRFGVVSGALSGIPDGVLLLDLRLEDGSGTTLAEHRRIFSTTTDLVPLVTLADTEVLLERSDADGSGGVRLTNVGSVAALSVRLSPAAMVREDVKLRSSANHVTLLPGESRRIGVAWAAAGSDRRLTLRGLNVPITTHP